MISVAQCAAFSGLASSELVLGVTPSARHDSLLSSYLLNLGRGSQTVRDMIVADLRSWLDLGARQRAADLLIVLRFFLSDHPEARCAPPRHEQEPIFPNCLQHPLSKRDSNSIARRRRPHVEKEALREISPSSCARVAQAEDDRDAAVGEQEDGVVVLLARRRPAKGDVARRLERCDVGDRVRSARARVESGACFSSETPDDAQIGGQPGERRFGALTNKDAN